jgi:hypothetical protein
MKQSGGGLITITASLRCDDTSAVVCSGKVADSRRFLLWICLDNVIHQLPKDVL